MTPIVTQEDAATAEIARVQLWQWSKYGVKTVSIQPAAFNAPHRIS
jgi:malate synthase